MPGTMMFDIPNVVGLAAGMVTDYEGSDDTQIAVTPAFNYQFENRYIRLSGPYLEDKYVTWD